MRCERCHELFKEEEMIEPDHIRVVKTTTRE